MPNMNPAALFLAEQIWGGDTAARYREEWQPYTQRLPREKLQAALNKSSLYLTRELSSAVNDHQRTTEE